MRVHPTYFTLGIKFGSLVLHECLKGVSAHLVVFFLVAVSVVMPLGFLCC
jgi:hypothetical protein